MIRLLNELTCDECGQIHTYEQLRVLGSSLPSTCRIESIQDWLTRYGWSWSDGIKQTVLCPVCSAKKRTS